MSLGTGRRLGWRVLAIMVAMLAGLPIHGAAPAGFGLMPLVDVERRLGDEVKQLGGLEQLAQTATYQQLATMGTPYLVECTGHEELPLLRNVALRVLRARDPHLATSCAIRVLAHSQLGLDYPNVEVTEFVKETTNTKASQDLIIAVLATWPIAREPITLVVFLRALPTEVMRSVLERLVADRATWEAMPATVRAHVISGAITTKAVSRETDAWVATELASFADVPGRPVQTYLALAKSLAGEQDVKRLLDVLNDGSVEVKWVIPILLNQFEFVSRSVDFPRDVRDAARRDVLVKLMADIAERRGRQ